MSAALFHCQFGAVQPSRGDRLMKVAAYNAAARMGGFDFRRKAGEHVGGALLLPPDAPDWARDPEQLWTMAEAAETRHDGQPARLIEFSIPREIAADQRLDFARAIAAPWAAEGAAVQIDLHCPRATDGDEQPHAHVVLSRRTLGADGYSKRKLPNKLWTANRGRDMRAQIAARMNAWLAGHGYDARVDHRRAADQGDPTPPERNVPKRSFEALKRQPNSPAARPARRVLAARRTRRHLRAAEHDVRQATKEVRHLTQQQEDSMKHQQTPNTIAPGSVEERETRRQRTIAAMMRRHYDTTWLPLSVAERIERIELDPRHGLADIWLRDGSRIRDFGDRIELHGPITEDAARETALAAQRHGWESVQVQGSEEYRRAVVRQLAILEPPIEEVEGYELDDADKAWIAEQRELRQLDAILGPAPKAHDVRSAVAARPQNRISPAIAPKPEAAARPAQSAVPRKVADQDGLSPNTPVLEAADRPASRLSPEAAVAWLTDAEQGKTPEEVRALRDAQAAAADGDEGVLEAVAKGDLRAAAVAANRWKQEQERLRQQAAVRAAEMDAGLPRNSGRGLR